MAEVHHSLLVDGQAHRIESQLTLFHLLLQLQRLFFVSPSLHFTSKGVGLQQRCFSSTSNLRKQIIPKLSDLTPPPTPAKKMQTSPHCLTRCNSLTSDAFPQFFASKRQPPITRLFFLPSLLPPLIKAVAEDSHAGVKSSCCQASSARPCRSPSAVRSIGEIPLVSLEITFHHPP